MAGSEKEKPPLGDPVLFGPNGEKTTSGLKNSQLWHQWAQEKQAEIAALKERLGEGDEMKVSVHRGGIRVKSIVCVKSYGDVRIYVVDLHDSVGYGYEESGYGYSGSRQIVLDSNEIDEPTTIVFETGSLEEWKIRVAVYHDRTAHIFLWKD